MRVENRKKCSKQEKNLQEMVFNELFKKFINYCEIDQNVLLKHNILNSEILK